MLNRPARQSSSRLWQRVSDPARTKQKQHRRRPQPDAEEEDDQEGGGETQEQQDVREEGRQ
eukprot:3754378-Alexandrium_andersonii.AAC.1